MKLFVACAVVIAVSCPAFSGAGAAGAAPPAQPAQEPAACAALHQEYENASKSLASNAVSSVDDSSRSASALRESRESNIIAQARFTMDLMRNNNCTMPTAAPSYQRYFNAALTCKRAEIADMARVLRGGAVADSLPQCDRTYWQPEEQ